MLVGDPPQRAGVNRSRANRHRPCSKRGAGPLAGDHLGESSVARCTAAAPPRESIQRDPSTGRRRTSRSKGPVCGRFAARPFRGILSFAMSGTRQRCLVGVSILCALALASCQQSSADGNSQDAAIRIHPVEVTGVRWISNSQPVEASCHCSEPSSIARAMPSASSATCNAVCLGSRGFLIARMSGPFTNRSGVDLLIHVLCNGNGEPSDVFSVHVSENGHEWIPIALSVTNDLGQMYASIDLGDNHARYQFIKIVSVTGARLHSTKGPRILGIEALHPAVGFGL